MTIGPQSLNPVCACAVSASLTSTVCVSEYLTRVPVRRAGLGRRLGVVQAGRNIGAIWFWPGGREFRRAKFRRAKFWPAKFRRANIRALTGGQKSRREVLASHQSRILSRYTIKVKSPASPFRPIIVCRAAVIRADIGIYME
jgi:hypothetical protein